MAFLAVGAFAVCLLPLGFSALTRHYRHDRGVDVRRVFIHVQHSRNGVLPAECAVQPLEVVIAPLGKPSLVLHPRHVLVRTRKHDADCPHLVGRYLPPDASRADAVAYGFGAVCHAVGELHQLTVKVGAYRVCVLGRCLAFDMVGMRPVSADPFTLLIWMLIYPMSVSCF